MNLFQNTRAECEKAAAETLAKSITEIAQVKSHVIFGIVGGSSVPGVFKHLLQVQVPWKQVHIFMIDERCVSLNSLECNYRMAYNTFIKELIDSKKIPKENVHPFLYDPENAPSSIKKYDQSLNELERKFDIILVSSGEDGHIGALFPKHNSVISENTTFFYINNAPKLPAKRMTAPRKLLQTAKVGVILFFGSKKQQAFENFSKPETKIVDCPAKLISTLPEYFVFKSPD